GEGVYRRLVSEPAEQPVAVHDIPDVHIAVLGAAGRPLAVGCEGGGEHGAGVGPRQAPHQLAVVGVPQAQVAVAGLLAFRAQGKVPAAGQDKTPIRRTGDAPDRLGVVLPGSAGLGRLLLRRVDGRLLGGLLDRRLFLRRLLDRRRLDGRELYRRLFFL